MMFITTSTDLFLFDVLRAHKLHKATQRVSSCTWPGVEKWIWDNVQKHCIFRIKCLNCFWHVHALYRVHDPR